MWVDGLEFRFEPDPGATGVTLFVHPTTKRWWGWPLVLVMWLWGALEASGAHAPVCGAH